MIALTLLCSAVTLASIVPLRHYLHPLEIFTYWTFIASFEQLTFTIVTLNLNDVQYEGRLPAFWSLKQATLIMVPVMIVWCLAWMERVRSVLGKGLVLAVTAALFLCGAHLFLKKGFVLYSHWSHVQTVLLFVGLTLFAAMFKLCFRALMKRENVSR